MTEAARKTRIYIALREHSALVDINEPLIQSVTETINKEFNHQNKELFEALEYFVLLLERVKYKDLTGRELSILEWSQSKIKNNKP